MATSAKSSETFRAERDRHLRYARRAGEASPAREWAVLDAKKAHRAMLRAIRTEARWNDWASDVDYSY